jgi:hypothetical protein
LAKSTLVCNMVIFIFAFFVLLIIAFLFCINFLFFYVMYQVANFSKACREAKCLSVDVASFPFEIPENLPQQTTTYLLVPFFLVCYVYLFFFSGMLLMNVYFRLTATFFRCSIWIIGKVRSSRHVNM